MNEKVSFLVSDEIADQIDASQFEPLSNKPNVKALMCVLTMSQTDSDDETFVGTMLSYDVDSEETKVTLDFESISLIMCGHSEGSMTVTTDLNETIIDQRPIRVKHYDLSGRTGVVTLAANTYKAEVYHG